VIARTTARYQAGVSSGWYGTIAKRWPRAGLSKLAIASAIVMKLSQAKLPETTSHDCVSTMISPATEAMGWGKNRNHGTTSCAK